MYLIRKRIVKFFTLFVCLQAPYNFGEAQVSVTLGPGRYLIVPSLYSTKSGAQGSFFLSVHTSYATAALEKGVTIPAENEVRLLTNLGAYDYQSHITACTPAMQLRLSRKALQSPLRMS